MRGKGDDVVQILFQPAAGSTGGMNLAELSPFDVFFDLNLGAGNDQAMVEWPSDPAEIVGKVRKLHLTIDAGAGDDVVQDRDPMTLVAERFVNIDLGAGNDTADLRYVGGGTPDPGALALTIFAETGNDTINAVASAYFEVDVRANLGAGDDQFALALNPDSLAVENVTSILHVNIDGGSGIDGTVLNVEHFTIDQLLAQLR